MKRLGLILALAALAACGDADTAASAPKRRTLPPSNGSHNDLTVICPEGLWQDFAGLAVATELGKPAPALPQSEPSFSIIHAAPEKVNDLLRRGKSLLNLAVIPDSTAVLVAHDVYARPQIAVQIVAPSAQALEAMLPEALREVSARLAAHDRQVLRSRMKRNAQNPLPKEVRALGIREMLLPEGFVVTLSKPDLVILRLETKKSTQYLILTRTPDSDSPTPEADVVSDRNALLKQYFEGPEAKSYLTTELLLPPSQSFRDAGGIRHLDTRGLFKTVGGYGGGPFVSTRSFLNDGSLGTADALLFAPGTSKNRLRMELELVTQSVVWGAR
ncbi:MAG: DUF4837 family protein [Schleiferiaceae bacterium]